MSLRPPGRGGSLAIVLHTHMPLVVGHGTWPFGEEWLWEAIATSYLPLLDLLDSGAPLTLSVTPVLADQLEDPKTNELCRAFLRELRPATHELDEAEERARGREDVAKAIRHSAAVYQEAAELWDELDGDLIGAWAQHAAWTSSATHEVLPLAAVDGAVRMQLETGIASHRRRFAGWNGGLWLPECGHAPWMDRLLAEAGVHTAVVDWTDVLGRGAKRNLVPHASPEGPTLVPMDRELTELVWSHDGYPAGPEYRDHHGLTTHHHRAWANDGTAYDPARAWEAVRRDATSFLDAVEKRLVGASGAVRDPLAVVAMDTELFGHHWHEGIWWLQTVVSQAAERGIEIERLDEAVARRRPVRIKEDPPETSWGRGRGFDVWSGPKAAEFAWRIRGTELRTRHNGKDASSPEQLRALLALEASDWAFLHEGGSTGDYPTERAEAHLDSVQGALESEFPDTLESIAPDLRPNALFSP